MNTVKTKKRNFNTIYFGIGALLSLCFLLIYPLTGIPFTETSALGLAGLWVLLFVVRWFEKVVSKDIKEGEVKFARLSKDEDYGSDMLNDPLYCDVPGNASYEALHFFDDIEK